MDTTTAAQRSLQITALCRTAKQASYRLAIMDTETKNAALRTMADELDAHAREILAANAEDVTDARRQNFAAQLIDRLRLTPEKLKQTAQGVRDVALLPDPVGEEIEHTVRPNGLIVRRVRVPLGVVAIVYEARPEVAADASSLALKSGNAVILRGSSMARRSDEIITSICSSALSRSGLPPGALSLAPEGGHEALADLATQDRYIDLLIPRGGEGLKEALKKVATVPLLLAASGNCHIYVDASADPEMAESIVVNAKTQRPAVCNAAEKLLVHTTIAASFLPKVMRALIDRGVELRVDTRTHALAPPDMTPCLKDATPEDWDTEFLALIMGVAVVDSLDDAIAHINLHGSGHSEAIVTGDEQAARVFQSGVDAAAVYWNASTRFTDGGRFGMGAEMGISTQKLHARGPIGLRELCSYKFIVNGTGQIVT
ncbi:MAG: glutamate-5-semialdehyde dehydrogenase [Candidatus Omnitrophota bacterium]